MAMRRQCKSRLTALCSACESESVVDFVESGAATLSADIGMPVVATFSPAGRTRHER